MNPILKYPGAKWRVSSWITSFFPPHEGYVDAFFGSGGVFFNKQPSRIETINDMDGEVVNFFRMCRERPDDLSEILMLTPWSREERNAAYEPTEDSLERARRFCVRCWQTFGAHPQKSNGWRHTTAKHRDGGPDNPRLWARLPQCVVEAADRLREAQIECKPAVDVIRGHNGPEALVYADPPYLRSTRTASGNAYTHEMTESDHEELLQVLLGHKGMVILSGYENDLYNDMLRGWRKETLRTTAERGAKRVESLWINPAACERNNANADT